MKCNLEGREYKVFGYKGKQVRDNIHSEDVAAFMFAFYEKPRIAEVYNLGGGKAELLLDSRSVRDDRGVDRQEARIARYVDENRIGDHIVYYSDLRKMKPHYPNWDITKSLDQTLREIVDAWQQRLVD